MSRPLDALRSSVERLAALVAPLGDDAIVRPAYPTEWTIAQVLSHLGSGAEIFTRLVTDSVAGVATPDDLAPSVWAEWDARTPRAQLDDAIACDAAFLAALDAVASDDRARFSMPFGPLTVDWDELIGMRLAEHLVHEWDVAVALNPGATLAPDGTPFVLERIGQIAGWTARAAGDPRTTTIAVDDPEQTYAVVIGADSAELATGVPVPPVDVMMPAEAFIRLVYGRLDPDHTPPEVVVADADLLDQLRAVFPGF